MRTDKCILSYFANRNNGDTNLEGCVCFLFVSSTACPFSLSFLIISHVGFFVASMHSHKRANTLADLWPQDLDESSK